MSQNTIIISGQTPAQKNNKQLYTNRATGKNFISSSDITKRWQAAALIELKSERRRFNKGRIQIDYMFYVIDDAQRDLDNMIASVNDILQQANALGQLKNGKLKLLKGTGIIAGDHWQKLRIGSADAAIDRAKPRAEITITELGDQE